MSIGRESVVLRRHLPALVVLLAACGVAVAASPARTVALSGDVAAGGASNVMSALGDGAPILNDQGDVLFYGDVGSPATNAMFRSLASSSTIDVVLRGDAGAGSLPPPLFLFQGTIDSNGEVFADALSVGSGQSAILRGAPGSLTSVATTGDAVPGLAGFQYGLGLAVASASTDAGTAVFQGQVTGPRSATAIFGLDAGSSTPAVIAIGGGDVGPIPGAKFGSVGFPPQFGGSGNVLIYDLLEVGPGGVTSSNNATLFATPLGSASGPLQVVAREGEILSALAPDAQIFNLAGRFGQTAAGTTYYTADLTGSSTTGFYLLGEDAGGSLQVVAREGAFAPDSAGTTSIDRRYGDSIQLRSVGNGGDVAFVTSLDDAAGNTTGRYGVFIDHGTGGTFRLAESFTPAPGAGTTSSGGNVNFSNVSDVDVAVNDVGDAVFLAPLSTAVSGIGTEAIYAHDGLTGALFAIVGVGELFDVDRTGMSPDLREVVDIDFVAAAAFRVGASGLNNNREVAFALEFADGSSGVFVTTIPAPGAAATGMLFAAGLAARRRRRLM